MITFRFKASFATPAFLGDADQNGRWRTPAFKALLRQWWRVVHVRDHPNLTVAELREKESELFGAASGASGVRSRVRIRLDAWQSGTLQRADWKPLGKFLHEEAGQGGRHITADSYLGFGPVMGGASTMRGERAIAPKEERSFSLGLSPRAFTAARSDEAARQLKEACALIHLYGTLGGRSRNGWGSLSLRPAAGAAPSHTHPPLGAWQDLLQTDWPSAIGTDDQGPLIWVTRPTKDWQSAMFELAIIRYRIRRSFSLHGLPTPHPEPADRHWLAYPVTNNHKVESWDRSRKGSPRLPNSLRLKVREHAQGFVGVVFHMPALPEKSTFKPTQKPLLKVWSKVHSTLDGRTPEVKLGLARAPC